jgi:hypothetical protein
MAKKLTPKEIKELKKLKAEKLNNQTVIIK